MADSMCNSGGGMDVDIGADDVDPLDAAGLDHFGSMINLNVVESQLWNMNCYLMSRRFIDSLPSSFL